LMLYFQSFAVVRRQDNRPRRGGKVAECGGLLPTCPVGIHRFSSIFNNL